MDVNMIAEKVRQEDQDTACSETEEDLIPTKTNYDKKTDTLGLAKLKLPAAHILEEIEDYQFLGGGFNAEAFTVKYQGRLACLKRGRKDSLSIFFKDEAQILLEVGGAGGAPTLLAYATDAPLIVTTLCQGIQLRQWIHSQPTYMNTTNFLDLAKEVVTNLKDVHNTDVIHNDIKDDNILVYFTDGRLKINIIDFGLATKIGSPVYFTYETRDEYDKFPWYAPEVFYGETTDYVSDVYSLGVLFYNILQDLRDEECLTFQPPEDLINLLDRMTHYDWIERPSMNKVIEALLNISDSDSYSSSPSLYSPHESYSQVCSPSQLCPYSCPPSIRQSPPNRPYSYSTHSSGRPQFKYDDHLSLNPRTVKPRPHLQQHQREVRERERDGWKSTGQGGEGWRERERGGRKCREGKQGERKWKEAEGVGEWRDIEQEGGWIERIGRKKVERSRTGRREGSMEKRKRRMGKNNKGKEKRNLWYRRRNLRGKSWREKQRKGKEEEEENQLSDGEKKNVKEKHGLRVDGIKEEIREGGEGRGGWRGQYGRKRRENDGWRRI
ncbi:hypothetical protein Pmani_015508 [Petrolisthes manimaculis]|uniref:Protein kinase domain-containing protein n=1 Tax=Petrolisthes manimaculis TaxID=1843537 RepID=A0AAE1PTR7_9EUCA|nr:hypothetical protein Pmani_015508 [Petrolisthes manimaculis]